MTDISSFIESLTPEQRIELGKILLNSSSVANKVEPEVDSEPEQAKSVNITDDFRVVRNNENSRKPVKAKKNEWVDTGENKDIVSNTGERVPRTRKPPVIVEVTCSVCSRKFKIDSSLVFGEFPRCDRCCAGR